MPTTKETEPKVSRLAPKITGLERRRQHAVVPERPDRIEDAHHAGHPGTMAAKRTHESLPFMNRGPSFPIAALFRVRSATSSPPRGTYPPPAERRGPISRFAATATAAAGVCRLVELRAAGDSASSRSSVRAPARCRH